MKINFTPFTNDMIPEAGRLLAARHARNRKTLPLLPPRFEDPQFAAKAVEFLWQNQLKDGYAAFCDGRMVAYLLGETTTLPWGRCGHVYLPGYALADEQPPTILQDLYALLGEAWVKKGYFNHYVYLSAADKTLIGSLFDLGFGKERVDALLDLNVLQVPDLESMAQLTIRKATTGDNHHLGSLSNVIFRALAKPPYWHPTVPEDWDDLKEGWSALADEAAWNVWLALENEQVLGMIGFCTEEEADTKLLASAKTAYLSVAATRPEARGRGINTALTWHGLEYARKEGYQVCYTNWISPNLLASRFWPRFGFQDVAYRLAKKISPMIAWAKDE